MCVIHVCPCVYVRASVCTCVCMHTCMCVCAYVDVASVGEVTDNRNQRSVEELDIKIYEWYFK